MKINELFNEKKLVYSMEIFPPKPTSAIETVYKMLEELKGVNPDFISVTYGAGGASISNRTLEIASLIKKKYNVEPMAHLTCIDSTYDEIRAILKALEDIGVENILALRGDGDETNPNHIKDFKYASDLVSFIRKENDFNVVGACYPEGHLHSKDIITDINNLKIKQDAGASHFISQLFFNNDYFYDFLDKSEAAGITVPIQAGIMPVVNKKSIERIVSLCGATLPKKFLRIMNKYENDPIALRDAGIAYAVEQMVDLISSGVRGIHLYSMNNPYVAKSITNSIGSIIKSVNKDENIEIAE